LHNILEIQEILLENPNLYQQHNSRMTGSASADRMKEKNILFCFYPVAFGDPVILLFAFAFFLQILV